MISRYKYLLSIIFFLIISCSSGLPKSNIKDSKVEGIYYIPAEVIVIDGNILTIKVEKPILFEGNSNLSFTLAKGILENSYFFEGTEYDLGKHRVQIEKIRGNDITVKVLSKTNLFKLRDKVRLFLEKKVIAIKDFEVVKGRNKEIARYLQEDITTALVSSGQFNVVERVKLKSVLGEIEFQLSGVVDSDTVKKVGNIVGADFILTGTLAPIREEWNVNLRLINTETGLITAAINRVGTLYELNAEVYKEYTNISENFENGYSNLSGWITGKKVNGRAGKGGYQYIYIDDTNGANNTKKSLAGGFRLDSNRTRNYEIYNYSTD